MLLSLMMLTLLVSFCIFLMVVLSVLSHSFSSTHPLTVPQFTSTAFSLKW